MNSGQVQLVIGQDMEGVLDLHKDERVLDTC